MLGIHWASGKKAVKMHTAVWQHLITQKQFPLLRVSLMEITVLICKNISIYTRMFKWHPSLCQKRGDGLKKLPIDREGAK